MGISDYFDVSSAVATRFRQEDIVPQIIKKPPDEVLKVKFKSGREAYFGNEINPTEAINPRCDWPAKNSALYTVAMFDPDVAVEYADDTTTYLHWLVVNVPGKRISQGLTAAVSSIERANCCSSSGDVLDNYVVPSPPEPHVFSHRYVELVYKQPRQIEETKPYERLDFDMQDFADDHGFDRPLAGNFFISTIE